MKPIGTHRAYALAVLLALIFYLWLAAQIPYTHDDWDWGLAQGIRHLVTADINSRYAGNLVEVLLTRSALLKTLVMGLVFTLLPLAAGELAGDCLRRLRGKGLDEKGRLALFLLANGLFLATPTAIWAQTCGWVAGFSNFVASGLLLLVYLALLLRLTEGERRPARAGVPGWLPYLLFGVVLQLFLENLSAWAVLAAAAFLVREIVFRKTRPDGRLIALAVGALAGLGLMFSSNMYQTLWDTGAAVGDYRQLTFQKDWSLGRILGEFLRRFLTEFVPALCRRNGLLMGALSLLVLLSGLRTAVRRGRLTKADGVLGSLTLLYGVYYFVCWLRTVLGGEALGVSGLTIGADCLFLVLVTAALCRVCGRTAGERFWLLLVWSAPFLLMAPMVVINTVGPRSFFTADLCFALLCLLLLAPLWRAWPGGFRKVVLAVCLVLALVAGVRWGHIYADIGAVSRERNAMLAQARRGEAASVTLPAYPHPEALWYPDPNNEYRVPYFREFYGIPDGVEVSFESWGE